MENIRKIVLWILGIGIVVLMPVYYYFFIKGNEEVTAQIGDSFGTINTLFSGLAFLGVIVAILLQSRELALQREELALTRGELAAAAKANQATADFIKRQVEIMYIPYNFTVEPVDAKLYQNEQGGYGKNGRDILELNLVFDHAEKMQINKHMPSMLHGSSLEQVGLWWSSSRQLSLFFDLGLNGFEGMDSEALFSQFNPELRSSSFMSVHAWKRDKDSVSVDIKLGYHRDELAGGGEKSLKLHRTSGLHLRALLRNKYKRNVDLQWQKRIA